MGEMADYLIEQETDYLDDDYGDYEEEGDGPPSFDPQWTASKILKCRFCNKSPLQWKQFNGKWIMFEMNNDIHDCPNNPLPIDTLKEIYQKKMNSNIKQLLPIPSWDEYFLRHVYLAASKSKDPRSKIGAILVKNGIIISEGYNGFARGVSDLEERYLDRKTKWNYVVHGECNSILNAARNGISTINSILYTNGIPCKECGKTIIQAGIVEVIIHKQWPEILSKEWEESVEITKIMFQESGLKIRSVNIILGLIGLVDGKIINV